MQWYQYVCAFFAGLFLVNSIPHFVNGVSGNAFPTPFSNPPGKGLSSPVTNVLWALLNIVVGFFLCRVGRVFFQNSSSIAVFFAGFAALSIMMAKSFVSKHKS